MSGQQYIDRMRREVAHTFVRLPVKRIKHVTMVYVWYIHTCVIYRNIQVYSAFESACLSALLVTPEMMSFSSGSAVYRSV